MKSILILPLVTLGLICVTCSWAQECDKLKVTAPRGLQCLHCTQPKAESAALALVPALLNSCIRNVALGFVLDGSFGKNFSIISKMTTLLRSHERQVFLHFYILNGPAQRRHMDNVFPQTFSQISPFDFRKKLLYDSRMQAKFSTLVRSHLDLFINLQAFGANISITPMLEDNFDDAAFNKSMALLKAALPQSLTITLVRNPCRDCFPGNGSQIPEGITREEHRGDTSFNFSNGIVSNDGWAYVQFPGDRAPSLTKPVSHTDNRIEKVVTLNDLKKPLLRASSLNNTYLLWLSKYQVTLPGNRSVHVNKRKYPLPKQRELQLIAEFLN